jgi:DNA-binding IclR family transcriptional regulator
LRDGQNYRLGLKVVELASVLLNDLDIRRLAEPILLNTAAILGEAAHLVLLDEGEVIYIDTKGSSQKIINMYSKVGCRAPLQATAAGKAMLAFLPEEEARAILVRKGLPRLTSTTITNLKELMGQLKEIRQTKIAHDFEENELGIYCIGTPVFNFTGKLAGGVSVSGPANRMKEKGLEYLASIVKKTGEDLSARLGYVQR